MYSNQFKNRLVNDYKLPIKVFDEPYFSYLLELYKDHLDVDAKIKSLQTSIEMAGSEEKLKQEWYRVKDLIEAEVKALPRFEDFLKYEPNYELKNTLFRTNPYNRDMLDKTCVSVDIRTANYNALKHFDAKLVFETKDFNEFITRFTEIPLFKDSKIFRQLLFEPLNAKKQGVVQKRIVHQTADELFPNLKPLMGKCVSNDELVLVFPRTEDLASIQSNVQEAVNSLCEFKDVLKVESFNVHHLHDKCFYKKTEKTFQLRNVSSQLYPQMFKKVMNMEVNDNDLVFWDTNTEQVAKYLNPVTFKGPNED